MSIPNKLLSIITKEQLEKDFKELNSIFKIAKKYNVTNSNVYGAMKHYELDYRIKKNSDKITKEMLQELYDECGSLKMIARKFNLHFSVIKRLMEKYELDYKKQVIHNCDHNFFSRDNEESFYIAGFIAADGCVMKNKKCDSYQLRIGLAIKDKNHLELIKEKLKSESPLTEKILLPNRKLEGCKKTSIIYTLSITSKNMFMDLARFNVVPRKTYIYQMSDWLINHPLLPHFLRGYIDGDGCFNITKKKKNKTAQINFALPATEMFVNQIKYVFEREQIVPINEDKKITDHGKYKSIAYQGNNLIARMFDYLYKDATIYLQRKYDKAVLSKKENNILDKTWEPKLTSGSRLIDKYSKEQLINDLKELKHYINVAKKYDVDVTTIYRAFDIINKNESIL